MQPVLYLRRLRDFGEKIRDSLLFMKRNAKNLLTVYALFVVPFIIAAVVVGIFFAGRLYSAILSNVDSFGAKDIFTLEFFVIIICLLLASSSYNTAIYCYFRCYDEQNGEKPTMQQVSQLYFRKFFPVFLYNIGISILLCLVAVIPMIILIFIPLLNILAIMLIAVVLFTVYLHINVIFVAEDVGIGGGINRLFDLFKNRWWHIIGYSIIMFLIYYVFSFVLQLIFMMVFSVGAIHYITPGDADVPTSSAAIYSIVLGVGFLILLQQVFYLILYCGIGINYYSLAEEKDGSAIESQIETIGSDSDKYGGVEEQY